MAYFAELDDTNTVLQVIAVSNTDAPDPAPHHSEPLGQAFIASLGLPGVWKQTSYNGTFRGRYAGIGYTYRADLDMFIALQPFASWTLDDNGDWQPPVPYPESGEWQWNEPDQTWEPLHGA